jgi:hypothetical protein
LNAVIAVTRVIGALVTLAPITIQAMFVKDARGAIDNTTSGVGLPWPVDRLISSLCAAAL